MNNRETSRANWNSGNTLEAINSGSLQRIADAVEKLASSYDALRNDRDMYKRWSEERGERNTRLEHSRRAYKAAITRLKKRIDYITTHSRTE